jgi:hypothetical protein
MSLDPRSLERNALAGTAVFVDFASRLLKTGREQGQMPRLRSDVFLRPRARPWGRAYVGAAVGLIGAVAHPRLRFEISHWAP